MADEFQKVRFLWGQGKTFKFDIHCQQKDKERLEILKMFEISSMTKNDASCSG